MQRIKESAELRLTEIALAILRNENRAFSLFKVVWLRNRNICELIRLNNFHLKTYLIVIKN